MRIVRYLTVIAVLLVMALIASCSSNNNQSEPALAISDVWIRPALKSGSTAAYFTIANNLNNPITLTDVSVDFAGVAQIHQTIVENDMAQMQHLDNGLTIGAEETIRLVPGGYHIMLMNVQQVLNEGDRVTLELTFNTGEVITIEALVRNNGSDLE